LIELDNVTTTPMWLDWTSCK